MKRSLRSWLWRVPLDDEIDEELDFHLDMRIRDLVARGVPPSDAHRLAIARLGDLRALRRQCTDEGRRRDRTMRLILWMDELCDDVKFAVRQLAAAPAFALVVAVTLALGIGANSAMFALVDAALLRPLPLPHPDRLVAVWERTSETAHGGVSPLDMTDWLERGRTIERIGGFVPSVGAMVMAGADGISQNVPRQWVTSGIFDALGIAPIVGRTFRPEDDRTRADVVVLSEGFWHERFGGDPTIVGRPIRLDGTPFTVVGVVPRQAQLIGKSSIWALRSFPRLPAVRAAHMFEVVARMKPGVTIEAATGDLSAVADGLAREFPATNQGSGVALEPLHAALVGRDLRLTSLLFLGVVGFVLLMCCANVANLLMARTTARGRELAIRGALGAGRRRLVRQLVTECLVLSVIGGLLGLGVGASILRIAPSMLPAGLLPSAVSLSFDLRVVVFCFATSLVVGILFALAPAWQATGLPVAQTLAADARTMTGRGGRLSGVLVGAEVAAAVLLLFGAGLLLRTLIAVDTVDRGYRAPSVLTMMVDPLGSRYPTGDSLLEFFRAIDREVEAVPGVRRVAWTSMLPMGESVFDDVEFEVAGARAPRDARRPMAGYAVVSPSYFPTLDLPIVDGRGFDDHDTRESVAICVINEALAQQYFHGRSPVGQQIAVRGSGSPQAAPIIREIVGVARQVNRRPDEREPFLQIYVPLAQDPADDMFAVVRPRTGDAAALAPSVRAAIARVDKEQLVSVRDLMTLDTISGHATSGHRFRAVLVMTFAGLALLLAMVGVFGILVYSVQQRARDLAVRRALGATTRHVLRLIVGRAVRVIATGAAVGLVLSTMLGRLLATMLVGVTPLDPATFAAVLIVLALTAAVAIAWPAWRAAEIDPAEILRS